MNSEAENVAISARMILEGYDNALKRQQEEQFTIDQQEALSIRYAHRLGLVRLASGRWAVFGGDGLLGIAENISALPLIDWYEAEIRGYETRRQAERPGSLIQALSGLNPEDLGL